MIMPRLVVIYYDSTALFVALGYFISLLVTLMQMMNLEHDVAHYRHEFAHV